MELTKKGKGLYKYLFIAAIAATALFIFNRYFSFSDYTPQQIKDYVNSFGGLAPIIYIIMFTFVPLTLFPDSLLAIAGGMCFGLFWGSIYTMVGALSGGTLAFYIARLIKKGLIKKPSSKDLGGLSKSIEERGFWIVLLLRLIPLFPYDVISYSAGLSGISIKDFLLATLLGTIPGIIVFTNVGDKATDIGSRDFYISLSLLVALLVISVILKNRFSLKKIEENNN